MDLDSLRQMAIEATARALQQKHDLVPSEDSDEWEEEYRRQFAALKQRYGGQVTAPRPATSSGAQRQLPELRGTPEELRWGNSIRDERMREIPSEAVRAFMVQLWPRAKQWVDTRDVPTQTLLQRLKPQYDDWRKKQTEAASARKAEAQKKAEEVAAYQRKLKAAGVTPEGLVEMVDASDRFDPAPIGAKLADITVTDRHLRIFETSDPNLLLVKEKDLRGNHEYAIERDEGLVADLKLFAQAP
jgi:DNA-binding protein H-NS